MRYQRRVYERGELQFTTASTYHRAPLFRSERFCRCFVQRLEEVRGEGLFKLAGWVLMPDHFHLPILPEPPDADHEVAERGDS
jgi:REP element-mobilizing transposase RayT